MAPLLRCHLYELAPDDQLLLFVLDHFICDGMSMRILVEDLALAYRELETRPDYALPDLPYQFADWAQWQRDLLSGERLTALEAYWRDRLGPDPAVVTTALTGYAVSATEQARSLDVVVGPALASQLRSAARERNVTLFTLMLSGFALCLARETGRTDLCVVTSVANRDQVALERVFGPMAHDAYLRFDVPASLDFGATVAACQQAMDELTVHGVVPNILLWERIWPRGAEDTLDAPSVYFSLNRPWFSGFRLPAATVRPFPIDPLMPMPGLECWVIDGEDDLTIGLGYLEGNYSESYLAGFTAQLVELLTAECCRR